MFDQNMTLCISSILNEKKITRVMVDNGSAVNILPKPTLLIIGLTPGKSRHSNLVIQGFKQSEQRPQENINQDEFQRD